MSRIYKIVLLITTLIFLTTYNPNKIVFFENNNNFFFKVKNIYISNNNRISQKDIIKKLNPIYKKSIFSISNNDIQKPLETINFLEKIEVKKIYPNTILIKVYESDPVGILFKNNTKYIIDSVSNLIPFNKNLIDSNLPDIFGKEAENDFINFFKQLKSTNFPIHKIKSYYYFKIDRWDLQLENGQIIKFPNKKRIKVIQQSLELLQRKDFKSYKVIDLRMPGKIVVE